MMVLATMMLSVVLSACDMDIHAFLYGEEKKEEQKDTEEECEHNWVLSQGGEKPTCQKGGYELLICSKCGEEKRNELDRVDHDYVNKKCQYCGQLAPADKSFNEGKAIVSAYNVGTGSNPVYNVLISGSGTITKVLWKDICSQIKTVSITGTNIELPDNAFLNDGMLTEVTVTGSLVSIGASAFQGCTKLKEITLPDGIVSVGAKAFFGCDQLTDISIGKTLTRMGKNAFGGCSRLRNLTLPFAGCNDREGSDATFGSLFDNGTASSYSQVYRGDNTESAVYFSIPDSLRNVTLTGNSPILSYSFADCEKPIDRLTLSADIEKIKRFAFHNNIGLKKLIIEEGSALDEIGEHAFDGCTALDSFFLPAGVKTLKVNVFSGCSAMSTFVFEEGSLLESVKAEAFLYCSSLSSVVLPEELTAIETNGFKGCTSLSEIHFGSKVVSLGNNAFADCSLKDVYIDSAAVANSTSNNASRLFSAGSGFGLWIEKSITIDSQSYLYSHYTCPNANYLTEKGGKKYVYWEIN